MVTTRSLFFYVVCLSLFPVAVSSVEASERLQFSGSGTHEILLLGTFNTSKGFSPGEMIFAYTDTRTSGQVSSFFQYEFVGRTGEKTFELRKIEKHFNDKTETKTSVYFDATEPLPLKDMGTYLRIGAGCSVDEVPKLVMIKLTGNELEARVLLPDCLKK
jgi:hypothetical protein